MALHSMSISLNLVQWVNLVTCYNLIIMSGLLLLRKNNSFPNVILAVILLLPGVTYLGNAFLNGADLYRFPGFIYVNQVASILGVLMIDYYVKLFTGQRSRISLSIYLLSFTGIGITIFYLLRFYLLHQPEQDQLVNQVIISNFPPHIKLLRVLFFALLNIFFVHLLYRIWSYRKLVLDVQSNTDKLRLRYIQSYVIIIWALYVSILITYACIPNQYVEFVVVPLITNIFYFYLLRTSLNHNVLFTSKDFTQYKAVVKEASQSITEPINGKTLEPDKLEVIGAKVNYLLEQKRVFTEAELNLIKFAEQVEQPSHLVSLYINRYLKTNFFNLINAKRIELAKQKMQIRKGKSEIEVIAFEVGFSSKSAFYRAFKKFSNQSPKEYIATLE